MEKIISRMKALGLTEYEAKAYLALLSIYPANGYVLSRESGIPRSRIYEVLAGLTKKQIVFENREDGNLSYFPLEPELLAEKLREGFEKSLESATLYAKRLYSEENALPETRMLKGRESVMDILRVLINKAESRISLSIWENELESVKPELDRALEKGVMLRGMYFGFRNPYPQLVSHRRIERYRAEKKERYLICLIDGRHSISGIVSREEQSQASWSSDPEVISINEDFIAHDVMINAYHSLLKNEEKQQFETALDNIRKDYYRYSDEEYRLFPKP